MCHVVTLDNYPVAEEAIRDILFMYRDLIVAYGGFGHNVDVGTFDPWLFVDARLTTEGHVSFVDIHLLHRGAAVALLCELSDYWDEHEGVGLLECAWGARLRAVVQEGRLRHLPLADEAMRAGFESEERFREALQDVYEDYVRGYFRKLIAKSLIDGS